jgi:glutamate formiminotransferase
VQVSLNLVDLDATGLETALLAARERVEARGGRVARVELVGLVPAAALVGASAELLAWSGLSPSVTIEGRAAAATGGPDASGATDATPGADRDRRA